MNEYKKEIKISVRNLVEFVLRTGDIDSSLPEAAGPSKVQGFIKKYRKPGQGV